MAKNVFDYHKGRFYGDPDNPKPLSSEKVKQNEGDYTVMKMKGQVGPVPKQTVYKQQDTTEKFKTGSPQVKAEILSKIEQNKKKK